MNINLSINASFTTDDQSLVELNTKLAEIFYLIQTNLEKEEYESINLSSSVSGTQTLNSHGVSGSQTVYLYKNSTNTNNNNAYLQQAGEEVPLDALDSL